MENPQPSTMKLKKVVSRTKGSGKTNKAAKDYYRYDITLPSKLVNDLGWNGGDELEASKVGRELRIKKQLGKN